MTIDKLTRARALAARCGVQTRAATVRGVLAAIRKHGTRAPTARPVRAQCTRWVTVDELSGPYAFDRGARVRTLPDGAALMAAIAVAVTGRPVTDTGQIMPGRYRGDAYESLCAASPCGRVIRVLYTRPVCPVRSGGGSRVVTADHAPTLIRTRDILRALPRLPAGWRWSADNLGPLIRVDGLPDWHPTFETTRAAMLERDPGWITRAAESFWIQRGYRDDGLAVIPLAKALRESHPDLRVTLADSMRAGNCEAGTRAWARLHRIPSRGVRLGDIPAGLLDDYRVARAVLKAGGAA